MFKVPAAPAPKETAKREIIAVIISTSVGAITRPTIHVNRTNDITLGFIKLKKYLKFSAETEDSPIDFIT